MVTKNTKRTTPLTAEQVQAERDALILSAATAGTVSEHLAILDRIAVVESAEQARDERNALVNARMRGAQMWSAYVGTEQERGNAVGEPKTTTFATLRGVLGIPDRPKSGEQGTPWHGMPFQTAEQAYGFHQYSPEDGWAEQAYAKFLTTADAEQVKYLGGRPSSLIGRLTFARRAATGADGITMPTSGTVAQRRDLLVASVIEAANAKIAERGADKRERDDIIGNLRAAAERGATGPLVPGVGGLSILTASVWTDDDLTKIIDALSMLKGRERETPEQVEQVEQVTTLVEQAEQVAPRVSTLSLLTPEQVAALTPEQVAALA